MGVGAAIGAGVAAAGVGASLYSAKKQRDVAKKGMAKSEAATAAEAQQRQLLSEQARGEAQLAAEQLQSAEQARGLVMGQLGAPGTYGPDLGVTPVGLSGVTVPGGLYGQRTVSGTVPGDVKRGLGAKPWEVSGVVPDPYATAAAITSQPQFATVSGMVAEAQQLMAREGPLWENLNNSVVGNIYEGAAVAQRQQMEEVSRAIARGGTARRAGLALAQKFQVQENINRQRSTALWQARMDLEKYRVSQAQQNIEFAQGWVNNQAGIRDTFNNVIAQLKTYWSQTIPGAAMAAGSQDLRGSLTAISTGNQALMDAANTKSEAIVSAVESLGGIAMNKWGTSGTPTTTATTPTTGTNPALTPTYGPTYNFVASGQGL